MGNIMQYFKFFPLLMSVVEFIRQAQVEFTGPHTGAEKMAWVIEHWTPEVTAFETAGLIKTPLADALRNAAGPIVELIVQILKAVHGGVPPAV